MILTLLRVAFDLLLLTYLSGLAVIALACTSSIARPVRLMRILIWPVYFIRLLRG